MDSASIRRALVRILALWTSFGLFFSLQAYLARAYLGGGLSLRTALVRWLLCAYAWAVLTPLVMWLSRRFPIGASRPWRALGVHVLAAFAFSVAGMLLYTLGEQALDPSGAFFTRDAFASLFVGGLHIDLLIYATLVGVLHALEHQRRHRERELGAAQLEAALARAELSALRQQLHPHFLFNTLNSIAVLMEEDARAARKMLVHLSELLRMMLRGDRAQEVSVKDEIELLESYLEIERMRFQDRLEIRLDVDPETLDARVPDLVLQPLVENAIKHGVVPRPSGGRVAVSVQKRKGELRLTVSDDGPGLGSGSSAGGAGLGLRNTQVRLEKLYGERHRFELERASPSGLCVVLTLPFRVGSAAALAAAPRGEA
jgi:two-component system, LytTR family, sensor kinase